MLLITAAELAATGALVIFWFQGLSAGKSWLPRSAGAVRSSSTSIRGRNDLPPLGRGLQTTPQRGRLPLADRVRGRMPCSHPLRNMKQPLGDKGIASHVHGDGGGGNDPVG